MKGLSRSPWVAKAAAVFLLAGAPVGLAGLAHSGAADPNPKSGEFVPGEILVKFKAGVSPEQIRRINDRLGTVVMERLAFIDVYRLKREGSGEVEDLVRRYADLPEVEYAEPNYKVRP